MAAACLHLRTEAEQPGLQISLPGQQGLSHGIAAEDGAAARAIMSSPPGHLLLHVQHGHVGRAEELAGTDPAPLALP